MPTPTTRYAFARRFGVSVSKLDALRRIWRFTMARVKDTQLQEVASSMTLTTLLSIIPLLAVSLAAFAAFPSFADSRAALEGMILESFLPPQYSEQLIEYIRLFTTHASGLGAAGLAGLSVTALLLIDKFFVTINRIFKVRRMRSWPQRALIYWGMLTLGPLAIALSLTMSREAFAVAGAGIENAGLTGTVLFWGQVFLQGFGYAILYKFVPNCQVPAKNALAGGFTVALAGQVVKNAFEIYVTQGTLSNIYGAFVAVPVFLLWLYVTWILVFAGAAITATIPLLVSGRFEDSYKLGNDFVTGVAMLKVLTQAREKGEPTVELATLCDAVDTYPEAAQRILSTLALAGYVAEVAAPRAADPASWALLCDPAKKDLREAAHLLLVDQTNSLVAPKRGGEAGVLTDWYRAWRGAPALTTPLCELFARSSETPAKPS